MLKGRVVDATTGSGIVARVFIAGMSVTTNSEGVYEISSKLIGNGSWELLVEANEYGLATAIATITDDAAMVRTIRLAPLSNGATLGQSGGTLTVTDPESLTAGASAVLTVAPGTFTGTQAVLFNRLTGAGIPGYAPAGMLNLCAFSIAATAVVPAKPMTVTLPLPVADPSIATLSLLKFDPTTITWSVVNGTQAVVDPSTHTATVQVDAFGYFSLAISGSYSESAGNGSTPVTIDLDKTRSQISFSFTATGQYTSVPAGVSAAWLKNIASQNTKLNGERVAFDQTTEVMLNYIGYKPDSLTTTQSAGYYRWMPRVTYTDYQMPVTASVNGMVITGTIGKRAYAPSSSYQFVHDQGGGGK